MTTRRRWPFIIASQSLWAIVWLLLSATHARLVLGFWPSYGRPDPKDVSPLFLDFLVLPLMLVAPLTCSVALGVGVRGCSPAARIGCAFP